MNFSVSDFFLFCYTKGILQLTVVPLIRLSPRGLNLIRANWEIKLRLSKVVQSQPSILLSDKRPKHGVDTVDSLGHETFLEGKGPIILEEGWSHLESGISPLL